MPSTLCVSCRAQQSRARSSSPLAPYSRQPLSNMDVTPGWLPRKLSRMMWRPMWELAPCVLVHSKFNGSLNLTEVVVVVTNSQQSWHPSTLMLHKLRHRLAPSTDNTRTLSGQSGGIPACLCAAQMKAVLALIGAGAGRTPWTATPQRQRPGRTAPAQSSWPRCHRGAQGPQRTG